MFSVTFYKDVTWQLRRFENKAACRCYLGLATENAVSIQALSYHYVCWEHAITHTFICSAPFVSCTALHMFFQCNSSRPGPRQSQSIVIKAFFGFCATCSITTTTNYPHNPLIILIFFPPIMYPPFFLFHFSFHSLWPSQDSSKSKWFLICMHLQNIACAVFAVKGIKKRVLVGVYVLPHWHQTALWYGNRRTGKEWLLTEALFGCRPKSIPSFLHLSIYSYPSLFSHTFLLPFMCLSLSPQH